MNPSPSRDVRSTPSTTPTLATVDDQPSMPPSAEIVRIAPNHQVLDALSPLSTSTAVSGQQADGISEHDLIGAILAHDKRARQHFRSMFWEQHPSIDRDASFEDVFGPPDDRNVAINPGQAARDLEECCILYRLIRSPSCSPMDRWLQASPCDEAVYVECLRCSRAETSGNAHQTTVALPSTDHDQTNNDNGAGPIERAETTTLRHERSWFEPGDSESEPDDASLLASGVSTPRNLTPQPRDPNFAEMIRAIISTFDTVD